MVKIMVYFTFFLARLKRSFSLPSFIVHSMEWDVTAVKPNQHLMLQVKCSDGLKGTASAT